jgi:hypothetical protein
MQNAELSRFVVPPVSAGLFPASSARAYVSRQAQESQKNIQFVGLLNAFRRSGGLARAPEVAARFKRQGVNDVSQLASWLLKRQVISVEWQSKIWLPLFQFSLTGMALRAGLSSVLSELVVRYDEWAIADWFAQPNVWLADCAPADVLAAAAPQVLIAARAAPWPDAE